MNFQYILMTYNQYPIGLICFSELNQEWKINLFDFQNPTVKLFANSAIDQINSWASSIKVPLEWNESEKRLITSTIERGITCYPWTERFWKYVCELFVHELKFQFLKGI